MHTTLLPLADLSTVSLIFLVLAIGLALAFEFVNGFHDTANAVATVIYTHALPPWIAVIWSGLWNFAGVLWSSGAVAFSILALLPVELVLNIGSSAGFAMVFALLFSAIIWNLGTWYLGLPASSSHTLIGAIMGVGLANSLMSPKGTLLQSLSNGVNWHKVMEIFISLIASPLIGFMCAAALLLVTKKLIRSPKLYEPPAGDAPPPWPIRVLLIFTCTGVSFAHGSNDGQKGMGLLLLILIGVLPATYAVNHGASSKDIAALADSANRSALIWSGRAQDTTLATPSDAAGEVSAYLKPGGAATGRTFAALAEINRHVAGELAGKKSLREVPAENVRALRTDMYLLSGAIAKLDSQKALSEQEALTLLSYKAGLTRTTQYIPLWVKIAVAVSLGLGTMIGWKRIVVTVGEKIGKTHLSYAQGAAAELIAMATIVAADVKGLPVSTTHVLSSGVAGTMAANRSGLQMETLRNLLIAWVLTLPVCIFLGATTFSGALFVIFTSPLGKALSFAGLLVVLGLVAWLRVRIRARRPGLLGTVIKEEAGRTARATGRSVGAL